MSDRKGFWDKKQQKYAIKDWIDKPTIFANEILNYIPKTGKLLELGAGHGQDSRFFANKSYEVTATDFSDEALKYLKEKTLSTKIVIEKLDLQEASFPYRNDSFDIIYSHMALHYFTLEVTKQLFSEILRVLKPGGMLAFIVNSTNDPEFGQGKELEDNYYQLEPGYVKRFFSIEDIEKLTDNYEIKLLDDKGKTHKDIAKGVFDQIRFVGLKK